VISAGTQLQLPLWAILATAVGVLALLQVIVVKIYFVFAFIAMFPQHYAVAKFYANILFIL